jgi:signal transduction histidine kinase
MMFTTLQQGFCYALGRYFRLHKQRNEATWARFLITSSFGLFFPTLFMTLGIVFGRMNIGLYTLLFSYSLGLFIAFSIHAFYRTIEYLLPVPALERLNRGGLEAGLFFAITPIVLMVVCFWLFGQITRIFANVELTNTPFDSARAAGQFLFISLLFALIGTYLAWQSDKRRSLQLKATEAQLMRLQAQIEPHFLFNSLAAVQSLIDVAPDRAKQMLEHFTDYLRTSLQTLRSDACTLDQELQAVQSYLSLMQMRMGDRLSFEIFAPSGVRQVTLPPLLLQPLVENAINHGLESKPAGGHIRISASAVGGFLVIEVHDNGLGLSAPKRRVRPGNGMALENIRARLAGRYGDAGALKVEITEGGCSASLQFPVDMEPVAS